MKKYLLLLLFLFSCTGKSPHSEYSASNHSNLQNYQARRKNEFGGIAKIGTPYEVLNRKYFPEYTEEYDKTGIASWYGPNFHGKKTANGEIYDQHGLTAAHKTLPMPCIVEVTNLENGKSMILRVNDRGPFVDDRIIDLSKRAAKDLGVLQKGTAKVRVKLLQAETNQMLAESYGDPFVLRRMAGLDIPDSGYMLAGNDNGEVLENEEIKIASLEPIVPSSKPEIIDITDIKEGKENSIFVQAGAFGVRENAQRLIKKLSYIGSPAIDEIKNKKGYSLYRVRFGVNDRNEAREILNRLEEVGHKGFIIERRV